MSMANLVFQVERSEPELISPATPTPHEFKNLTNIDDQNSLRCQIPFIHFYHQVAGMEERDPVKMIKEAIAKALVYYYPLAGRLREAPNEKLMVECTGEGVMFTEAKADVKLEEFGNILAPPFPCIMDLLYHGPGSGDILHAPMLLIQVTRFQCGGFSVGIHLNHTISDGIGLVQFMTAVGELARGVPIPSIKPVWERELLDSRNPPHVSFDHHMYQSQSEDMNLDFAAQANQALFFGPQEIACLRNQLPPHFRSCSRFQILSAFLWRCRTAALCLNPTEKTGLGYPVNARGIFNPPLPVGYYGNAIGFAIALSTVGELCGNPLEYAVELVRRAKEDVTDEFMRSYIDHLIQKFPFKMPPISMYAVSDMTRMGFNEVDFGWGKGAYCGPIGGIPGGTFLLPFKNNNGEDGILATNTLPAPAMEKFIIQVRKNMTGCLDPCNPEC